MIARSGTPPWTTISSVAPPSTVAASVLAERLPSAAAKTWTIPSIPPAAPPSKRICTDAGSGRTKDASRSRAIGRTSRSAVAVRNRATSGAPSGSSAAAVQDGETVGARAARDRQVTAPRGSRSASPTGTPATG